MTAEHLIQSREFARELLIHRVADQSRRVAEAIRMLTYDLGRVSVSVAEQRDLAAAVQMDPGDCERALQDLEHLGILRVSRGDGVWLYELLPDSKLWQRRKKRAVDEQSIVRAREAWLRIESGAIPSTPDLAGLIKRPAELARDGGFNALIAESNREAAVASATGRYAPGALLAAVTEQLYGGDANLGTAQSSRPAVQRAEDQGGGNGLGNSQSPRPAGPRLGVELGNSQSPETFTASNQANNCEIPNRSAPGFAGGLGISQLAEPCRLGNSQSTPPAHDDMTYHRGVPTELMNHEDERGGAGFHDGEAPSAGISEGLRSAYERGLYNRIERLLMPVRMDRSFCHTWIKRLRENPHQVDEAISDTECVKREGRIQKSVGGTLNLYFLRACGIQPKKKPAPR